MRVVVPLPYIDLLHLKNNLYYNIPTFKIDNSLASPLAAQRYKCLVAIYKLYIIWFQQPFKTRDPQ